MKDYGKELERRMIHREKIARWTEKLIQPKGLSREWFKLGKTENNKMKLKNKDVHKGAAIPWFWLNDGENKAGADDCGCALVRNYKGGGPAVFLCPLHEAAPELLAALEGLVVDDSGGPCWCECAIGNPMMGGKHSAACLAARAVISKTQAKGE